jgi:hypothetical protein|tara:strand:- start:39240 stop:39461 length:222 start_codon:yes stop_codon:yes gene_type:complete
MKSTDFSWNQCSCGSKLLKEYDHIDLVYPVNREKTKYNAYCNSSLGGCGRTVYGKDIEEVNKRWNEGITDEKL